jgi:hypothetical protein
MLNPFTSLMLNGLYKLMTGQKLSFKKKAFLYQVPSWMMSISNGKINYKKNAKIFASTYQNVLVY